MNRDIQQLLTRGYSHLLREDYQQADACYRQVTEKLPDQPVGYIGRARALAIRPDGFSYSELSLPILRCRNLHCDPEYREELTKLVNLQSGAGGLPLISFAAHGYRYDMVKVLVDLGAEVDLRCDNKTSPLWFVCRKWIPEEHLENGRKIALLLLEMGAEVDVTNSGGIPLYNQHTDPEIAAMILRYHPNAVKGCAPGSNPQQSGSSGEGVSIALCLGLGGAAIGIILGTVFDKFFAGFLWAAVLGIVGAILGGQIDNIRQQGREALGKAVRNLLIGVAALGIFGMLLANCVRDDRSFGYCPNCGSRMETQYIRGGSCSRCNGTDWN